MEFTGTAKRILDASLELFSRYGYDTVSMEQIADAVGIKAPSVYKHFKGKQDIFASIFALMDEQYREQIARMQMHMESGASDLQVFRAITEDDLQAKVIALVQFSLHDAYNAKFRRLLTTHQFANADAGRLYTERYVEMLLKYHSELFRQMIDAQVFVPGDADMMALQYVAPVYTLIGICDRDPDREPACMEMLRRHIHQFNEVYRTDRR